MPTLPPETADLLDDFELVDPRGGRRRSRELECEIVRELTADDLPALNDRSLSPKASLPTLLSIRSSHHQLAQLLAKGEQQEVVALITGYSPAYISRLKADPAFKELLDYYSQNRQAVFVDVLERMKALGVATLEELQERLATDPAGFSNRELHEQLKLLLVDQPRSTAAGQSGANGPAGVVVNVSFVSADSPAPLLDLKANDK